MVVHNDRYCSEDYFSTQVGDSYKLLGSVYLSKGRVEQAKKHLAKVTGRGLSLISMICLILEAQNPTLSYRLGMLTVQS